MLKKLIKLLNLTRLLLEKTAKKVIDWTAWTLVLIPATIYTGADIWDKSKLLVGNSLSS